LNKTGKAMIKNLQTSKKNLESHKNLLKGTKMKNQKLKRSFALVVNR
jgi:hypothetical protein